MHTKKRNRLLHKRLNDLVYVAYNRKMFSRFLKRKEMAGKSYDPLVLEDFDWDNEWVDTSVVHAGRGGDDDDIVDLTWDDVDEAVGASQALGGRNFPRRARMKANYGRRGGPMRVQEDEQEEDGDDPCNEEVDPEDDVNVSDSDGDKDGEDGGDANNSPLRDEFDDGY